MFKAIVVLVIVLAIVFGGMLALRSSRRTGMPSEDVLKRATERAREQAAEDDAKR
jgi:Protein of unknown function (DUF2897)